ncbi:unnamed protein product [Ectocarpus sp. 12 AP-2014]
MLPFGGVRLMFHTLKARIEERLLSFSSPSKRVLLKLLFFAFSHMCCHSLPPAASRLNPPLRMALCPLSFFSIAFDDRPGLLKSVLQYLYHACVLLSPRVSACPHRPLIYILPRLATNLKPSNTIHTTVSSLVHVCLRLHLLVFSLSSAANCPQTQDDELGTRNSV